MANQKTNDFYAVRSRMLEKYNVGSGTSSKQSGQKSGGESPENDEFMTVRQKLLEKYSDDSAQKNRTSVYNWAKRFDTAMSGFTDYDKKRNGGYTKDASGGFGSEIDSLIQDFESIRGYAGRFGLPNAQQYLKQLQQLKQYIGDTSATMAQFSNEDDYNTAVRYSGYYQKYNGQTYSQLQDTLSKMEDGEEKDWLTQYAPQTMTDRDFGIQAAQYNTDIYYAKKYLDEYKTLSDAYGSGGQEADERILAQMQALSEKYGFKNKQEAESALRKLENEKQDLDQMRDIGSHSVISGYDRIMENGDFGFSAAAGWQKYLRDQEAQAYDKDTANEWLSRPHFGVSGLEMASLNLATDDRYKLPSDQWTMEEKGVYGYLYGLDPEKAEQFAIATNNYYNGNKQNAQFENVEQFANDHPVASTVGGIFSGAAGLGMADFLTAGIEKFARGTNTQRSFVSPHQAAETATRTVAKNLNNQYGTISESVPVLGGHGLGDAYQLLNSIITSSIAANTVGTIGTDVVFFGNAAASAMDDARNRGATDEQALLMALISGSAEAAGEHFSTSHLLEMTDSKTIKQFFGTMFGQALEEGEEELFTSFVNNLADNYIMRDKSNFNRDVESYKKNNPDATDEEAKKAAWKQMWCDMAFDFLGGFVSGGVHTAGQTALNRIESNANYHSVYGGSAAQLVQEGLASPEGTDSRALAEKLQQKMDSGEELSGSDLRRLVQANEQQIRAESLETDGFYVGQNAEKGRTEITFSEKPSEAVQTALKENGFKWSKKNKVWYGNVSQEQARQIAQNALGKTETADAKSSETFDSIKNNSIVGNNPNVESKTAKNDSIRQAPVEDKPFELSDETGKTLLNLADGSTVETEITGIASTEKGKLMLNVSGQSEPVRASSISYASTADATLYNAINSMEISPEDAKRFVNLARSSGDTTGEFAVGIQQMYILGKSGVPISKAMSSSYGAKLSDTNKRFGYAMGRALYNAQVQKAEAQKKNVAASQRARASTGGTKVNGVQYDGLTVSKGKDGSNKPRKIGHVKGYGVRIADMNKALNPTQKKAYNVLTEIAKVTGIDIVLFKSTVDGNGNLVGGIIDGIDMRNSQGAFSFHNNKIYIDLNAGILQGSEMKDVAKYSMLRTFTHEFTHFIEKWSPTEYENLRGIVFDTMKKNGADPDSMIAARMERDNGLTEDQASREVVAESLTDILPQSSFVQNLAEKHRNIFQKLYDKLKEFTARIKDYFDSIGETRSPETQAVKETFGEALRYNDEIVKLFDKAAEVAVENYQDAVADKKSTTQEGGVQYEIRKSFYGEFDAWDGKNPSVTFTIGTTSSALQSIGMKDQEIKMRSGMVISKMNKHPEMKKDLFRQIPELLENPVIVQFSDAIDPKTGKPKYDSSITVLGELYAEVKENGKINKKPVLVSLELMPTRKNSTTVRDFSVVKSAYSKGALQQYINENTILYIDPNTKRTNSWLSLTGLQLPVGENRYGSIRRISYADGKIKVQNSRNSTAFQKALEKAGAVDTFGNPIATRNGGSSHQERTSTLTNLDILQSASNEVDFGELTPAEIDALKIYRNRLSDVQKTEKAVLELQNMENLSVADKNRLNILEKKLERQSANLWEIGQKKVIAGIAEKAKNKLIEKYGTIPTGENPSRKTSVPYRTSDDSLVSRTVRTAIEAAATTDEAAELIQQKVVEGEFSYLPITDDASNKRAEETLRKKGWDDALSDWRGDMRKTAFPGKDMVALGFRLYNNAVNTGDTKTAIQILTDITNTVRNSAQVVQAVRILKQLSPENRLYAIKRQIDSLQDELNKRYGEKAPLWPKTT